MIKIGTNNPCLKYVVLEFFVKQSIGCINSSLALLWQKIVYQDHAPPEVGLYKPQYRHDLSLKGESGSV